MAECWKCAKEESCEWATPREIICSGFTQRKRTNYDRVIQKTPEELAKWIEGIRLCCATGFCERSCPLGEVCYSNAEAPKETLDWLRQEVEE